jgi:hypothetical protein
MKTLGTVVLLSALALAACEKDTGLPSKTSGTMRKPESTLLEHLPGGNVAIFGGNYMRLQGYLQRGPMAKLMGQMESLAPGMTEWSQCFLDGDLAKLEMIGVVSYQNDEAVMAFAMKGFGMAAVEACAKRASFSTTLDPDGKYISIEMPSAMGKTRSGYLLLDDGVLFSRQALPFPSGGLPIDTTRADLEAGVAAAARKNASADTALLAEAAKVDRDRAVWFAADLSSTPVADKVGLMRGWIDLGKGLAIDVDVQLTDPATADEIAKGIPEMKKQAGMLGKDAAEVIRGLKFERKGDRVRFGLRMSDAQLEAIFSSMGGLLGGGSLGAP